MNKHIPKPKSVVKFENDKQRKQASKEAGKRYRDRNKEKLKIKSKETYERTKLTARERRKQAPDILTCYDCNKEKEKTQFVKAPDRKIGYTHICLECQRQRYGSGDYLIKKMVAHAKKRAEQLNLPFDITVDYLITLKTETCPILGTPLHWIKQLGKSYGKHEDKDGSPSLDRVIPNLGYIEGNVQIVSWRGNRLKNNATTQEVRNILEYMEKFEKR